MKSIYLIDASVYVFRAYFSLPSRIKDQDSNPANAIYGFAGFLCQFLEQTKPTHIAIAFDKSLTTSFRNDFYPDYKAQRELPPPELEAQFEHCMALSRALGLPTFVNTIYEADDIIGTLAEAMRHRGFANMIVTSDKDLAQIIGKNDTLWDFAKDRKLNYNGVQEHFGVLPEQIVDYLALVGDKVDNIPGVAGVGAKTAVALLNHFGSLENLYERIDELPGLKIRGAKRVAEALQHSRESAFLSQKLARIATDVPLDSKGDALIWQPLDMQEIVRMFDYLKFGQGIRGRVEGLAEFAGNN